MANNSGVTKEVLNPLERVMAEDVDRLQNFQSRNVSDILKYLYGVQNGTLLSGSTNQVDGTAMGPQHPNTSPDTPAVGMVLSGFELSINSASIVVTPGMLSMPLATGAGSDDSTFVLASDALGSAALGFTVNAGLIRWDVVEVSVTPNVVTETATRDVWSTATHQFVSTPGLTKVVIGQVTYRIRTGTPGADPTFAQDWMPIAMIHHPGATANFDACNIFDVRPLARDIVTPLVSDAIGNLSSFGSKAYERMHGMSAAVTYYGANTQNGSFSIDSQFCPYPGYTFHFTHSHAVRGSVVAVDSTGADTGQPMLIEGLPAIGAAGHYFAQGSVRPAADSAWFYAALLFPWGLPRWVRYSKAAIYGARRLVGCGGIFALVAQGGAARLPTYWSTVATSHPNMFFAPMLYAGSTGYVHPMQSDGNGLVRFAVSSTPASNVPNRIVTGGTSFTLTRGTQLPNLALYISQVEIGLESGGAGPIRFMHAWGSYPGTLEQVAGVINSVGAGWNRETVTVTGTPFASNIAMTTNVNTTSIITTGVRVSHAGKL